MAHLYNRKPLGESVQHNPFKKGFYRRDTIEPLLPALAFGCVLTWLSLSAGVSLPDQLWSPDKLAHFGAYGVWAWLWGWGRGKAGLAWSWWAIALGCVAWGLLMEGIQGLMPWRTFEWGDALANGLGAVVGIGMYEFFHNKTT